MERWHRILMAAVLVVGGAASPAVGQVCNGLPFRGRGIVAASYMDGDAADSPYALHQYGGILVHQLPGWSPLGTHQVVRIEGMVGRASLDSLVVATGSATHFAGSGGTAGASYTVDVLPASYAGEYVLCLSAGVQGQWWHVTGMDGGGVTLPVWLSFGAPLRRGPTGFFPHASFGAYWRTVTGQAPAGPVRSHGVLPWADAGVGLLLGRTRVDAVIRHELRARERALVTFAFQL